MQSVIFGAGIAAFVGFTLYYINNRLYGFLAKEALWRTTWTAALGAVLGAIAAAAIVPQFVPKIIEMSDPDTLVALRGVQSDEGIFALGTGSFRSGGAYRIFRKNKDGSVSPVDLVAESTLRIKEDPSLKNIGYWRTEYSNLDQKSPLYQFSLGWFFEHQITGQELQVPVGTVVQSFTTN